MSWKDEYRNFVRPHLEKSDKLLELDRRAGACPECGDMPVDGEKLAKEGTLAGVSFGTEFISGVIALSKSLDNWPKPVLDDEYVINNNPLEVKCPNCDNRYEPPVGFT